MRRAGRSWLLATFATLALASPAGAQTRVEGSLLLESDSAWRVYSPRVAQKSQNRAELDVDVKLGDAWRIHGLGRVLWDPVGRLVGDDPDFAQSPVDRWQVGGSRHLEAELRELYAHWIGRAGPARLDVRLGKQQIVWGQSFGLRVLDMINAQDFREFILDDFVDARTPVWGARTDLLVAGWTLQGLWFPDFEPDALADPESEFALDPELVGLLPALAAGPGGAPIAAFADADTPADGDPSTWGFGFRAARVIGEWDVALHYWDRIDTRGVFERRLAPLPDPRGRSAPLNVLQRRFPRVRTLGFSFSTTLGDFALWGEGGAGFGRGFVVNDLADADGYVTRPDLEYAIGLDWAAWDFLFANLQFVQLAIFDHDRSIDLESHREFLSVLLRFNLLGETLFPQLFVLYGVQRNESLVRPSIEWQASDRLAITAGADFFSGPREGLLGQFAVRREPNPLFDAPAGRTSRVFLRFRYEFGFGT